MHPWAFEFISPTIIHVSRHCYLSPSLITLTGENERSRVSPSTYPTSPSEAAWGAQGTQTQNEATHGLDSQFPQPPYHWWPTTRPCSTWLHIFDAHPYPKAFLSGTHTPLPSTFTSNSRLTPFKRGQKAQKWSSLFHYLKCLKSFIYLLLKIPEAPFYL